MSNWQHQVYQHTEDTNQLRLRITNLFMLCCLKDHDILEILRQKRYQIGQEQLVRVRKELGLFRRVSGKKNMKAVEQELQKLVREEFD